MKRKNIITILSSGIFFTLFLVGFLRLTAFAAPAESTQFTANAEEKPLTAVITVPRTSGAGTFNFGPNGFDSKSLNLDKELNKHNWTYRWNFGDGTAEIVDPKPVKSWTDNSHPLPIGESDPNKLKNFYTYNVGLTVNDGSNQDSTSIKINYFPSTFQMMENNVLVKDTANVTYKFRKINSPEPVISVDARYGEVPLTIHASAEYSTSGYSSDTISYPNASTGPVQYQGVKNIDEYKWDCGDGSDPIIGKTLHHNYTEAGTYILTLTVNNKFNILVNQVVHSYEAPATQSYIIKVYPNNVLKARIVLDESLVLKASRRNYTRNNGEPILLNRGYAPFPVFFEGWQSSPRAEIVDYKWDFGAGTENDEGGRYFHGFNAAHVYEKDGVYDVTLTVTNKNGVKASESIKIKALARDGKRYYVDSVNGDDLYTGDSSTVETGKVGPWKTATKALERLGASANSYQPGDTIYFQRGQVFDLNKSFVFQSKVNSVYFTAYPDDTSIPKPVIQNLGVNRNYILSKSGNTDLVNLAFSDLEINLKSNSVDCATGFINIVGKSRGFLFLHSLGRNLLNSFIGVNYTMSDGMANEPSGTFVVGSKLTNDHFIPTGEAIVIYHKGARFAMVNSAIDRSNNHGIYSSINVGLFSGSTISRTSWGRTALRIDGVRGEFDPDANILITGNKFLGWIDGIDSTNYAGLDPYERTRAHGNGLQYNLLLLQLGPNTGDPHRIKNVVVEKNIFTNFQSALGLANCEDVVVKNNLFISPSPESAPKISIGMDMQTKPNQRLKIINNTFLLKNGSSGMYSGEVFRVLPYYNAGRPIPDEWIPYFCDEDISGEHQDVQIKNNIIYFTSGSSGKVLNILYYPANQSLLNEIKTDYNFYYMPTNSSGKIFRLNNNWPSTSGVEYTFDDWKRAFPDHDANSYYGDPKLLGPVEMREHLVNTADSEGSPYTYEEAVSETFGYTEALKLEASSPAMNHGISDYDGILNDDFSGTIRKDIDSSIDVGAYEYNPSPTPIDHQPRIVNLTALPAIGVSPLIVAFTAQIEDVDGGLLTPTWDLGDGATSNQLVLNHSYSASGFYYPTFKVKDSQDLVNIRPKLITVYPTLHMQSLNKSSYNHVPEDTNVTLGPDSLSMINLAKGAIDKDGGANTGGFVYSIVKDPVHGTISGSSPNFLYTPVANFYGLDTFSIQANDRGVDTNVAKVYITLAAVEDAPYAPENLRITSLLATRVDLAWDPTTDPDGNLKGYKLYRNGTLLSSPIVTTYTDATIVAGVSYTYEVSAIDTKGKESAKSLSVSIGNGVNNPPTISSVADRTIDGNTDTGAIALTIGDPETPAANLTLTGSSSNTALVPNANIVFGGTGANRTVTVTPLANKSGTAVITLTVSDGSLTANDIFILTVSAINNPPIANAQSVAVGKNIPKVITLVATDAESAPEALTYTIVSNPTHGTLSGIGKTRTYAPANNYYGADSFTFKVNDGQVDSNPATVSINVVAIPNAPRDLTASAVAGSGEINLSWIDWSNNEDGFQIERSLTGEEGSFIITRMNSPHSPTRTTYLDAGLNPGTYYYRVCAFNEAGNSAYSNNGVLVSATIIPAETNRPPVVPIQSVTATEDTVKSFTLVASDPDGDALTYTIVTNPIHGTLTGSDKNRIYTPAANYSGSDSFTFKVNDGTVDSNTATVSITVAAVNDAPIANSQRLTISQSEPLAITLTGSDVETPANNLIYSIVIPPTYGTLSGSGANITYTPATNYGGPDAFAFKVNDGTTDSAAAWVSITVIAAPTISNIANQTIYANGSTSAIAFTIGDLETPAGNLALSVNSSNTTLVPVPNITLGGSGSSRTVTVTPIANQTGNATITITVTDGSGLTANSAFVLTVNNDVLNSITISVDNPVILTIEPAQCTAIGHYLSGDKNITSNVVWTSSDQTIGAFNPNAGYEGLFWGRKIGTVIVNAAFNGLTSNSNNIMVTDLVSSFVISIPNTSLTAGSTSQLTGTINYMYSDPADVTSLVTWNSSNTSVATVSSTGLLTALTAGQTTITATKAHWDNSSNSQIIITSNILTITVNNVNNTITASAGLNGNITPSGAVTVTQGANRSFAIAAASGYSISDVLVDGVSVGAVANYNFTNVITNHTISASFRVTPPSAYIITASAGPNGNISPLGAVSVSSGENQTFAIAPSTGYHIASVSVDGAAVGAVSTYTFTGVAATHTISATFAINTYSITASAGANGSITPSATVNYGASKTFTIAPNSGYDILSVSVDGVSQVAITSYTFDNVTADHAIVANFAAIEINNPPVAYGQSVSTTMNSAISINLIATDSDDDSDSLRYEITSPAHGILSGSGANLIYTPAANYYGPDSFTFQAYDDGGLGSNVATVSITIPAPIIRRR